MSHARKSLLALGVLALWTALQIWRLGAPAVAPADATSDTFSATRAIATLRAVSLDEPHPLTTRAHDVIRDRIAAEMKALGYDVDLQHAFACSANAVCGDVANLIATVPGQPRGRPAVAVVAHYDSVPAGPGASDDGTGVATVIEVARVLRHEQLANPVVFLIDDGEEAGLLGASAFLADRERSKDIALVINIEARGTSGTPYLFETSRDNRWLIPIVARELPRPVTTSLFATIYDQLPNDTDLSEFKRAGRAGINFAYIGDGTQYHTPLDSFASIDPGSVQQRGDQVLAMARAFGNATLELGTPGDAVWFDVLALFVVWWPASWSLWIAGIAIALVVAAIVLGRRRGEVTVPGVLIGVACFLAAVALAAGIGAALAWVLGLREPGALFIPHAGPTIAAGWLAGLTAAVAAAALARKRASFDSIVLGHAVVWNALAVVLAIALPGAAYLAIVPGTALACLALLRSLARTGELVTSVVALAATAAVCVPPSLLLHDTLGGGVWLIAVDVALLGTTFAPMLATAARQVVPALLAATTVLAVIARLVPNTSPSHPRHLSLAYQADRDAGTARWQADWLPPMLRAVTRFDAAPQSIAPWLAYPRLTHVAPAPIIALDTPAVAVATTPGDGTRIATLDVSSPRRAPRLTITWRSDAALEAIRVNGVALPPVATERWLRPGWHRVSVRGSSARLEITTRGAAPVEAIVSDSSYGLPAIGISLQLARDVSGAVPVHDGDVTIVRRTVTW